MAGAPDLFVVCKHCQSEVSPYITECPYCGQRLRKRAPKIDREGRLSEPEPAPEPPPPPPPPPKPRRKPAPRLRPVERPRAERAPRRYRPIATILLVLAALVTTFGSQAGIWSLEPLVIAGDVGAEGWRLLTASFVYATSGYEAVGVATVALFGWLLERRHGAWATLTVYVLGTLLGSVLVVAFDGDTGLSMGANAAGLALLCAWAMRDVLGRRRGHEDESDMLGVAFWFALLLLLPLATGEAHPLAGLGGVTVGVLLGLLLARLPER